MNFTTRKGSSHQRSTSTTNRMNRKQTGITQHGNLFLDYTFLLFLCIIPPGSPFLSSLMRINLLNLSSNLDKLKRGRRLAWSRLGDLGSLDPGSNPGDPTKILFAGFMGFYQRDRLEGDLMFVLRLHFESLLLQPLQGFIHI